MDKNRIRRINYTIEIDVLYEDIDIERLRALIDEDIDFAICQYAVEGPSDVSVLAWKIESTGD